MAEFQNQLTTLAKSATLPSGATNGDRQQNKGGRGILVAVDITASSGTSPTLTLKLQEFFPGANAGAGRWVDITGAATAAIDATQVGTTKLIVYPGVTVASNAAVSRPVSEYWRYVATVGGSNTPTVTCSFHAATLV